MEPISEGAAVDLKKDNVILNKLGEFDAFNKPPKPTPAKPTEETKTQVQDLGNRLKVLENEIKTIQEEVKPDAIKPQEPAKIKMIKQLLSEQRIRQKQKHIQELRTKLIN